ncbi:T9SS type A sorting domain-containing protein [uncultured Flavobacterium sp.]|uniref:T9SS type A sorting domain-containing protein n=1 Tax=uncultured Flavobacterium sp. TaxID=165435 RepID=UPI0025DE7177|nr:T9SS type A sorting domain-containing protein [uncultured Flavobacterium sp.]
MKTKLLSLIFAMVLTSSITNAQTKIWDLGGGIAPWTAANSPYTSNTIIDNLGLQIQGGTGSANFGATNPSVKTFATTPAYTSVNRFQLNGGGSPATGTFLPTQRFLYFAAAGSVTVEVLFIGGGSGSRTMYVTDGTNVLGSLTATDSATLQILTTTATVVNGYVYIYGDQACNLYRVKVTGPLGTTTLATNDFKAGSSVKVHSTGKQVRISNVISNTQVDVYSITGALVKSFQTNTDTSFDSLNAGFYIVNVQSEEGRKAVKIAMQ